MPDYTKNAESIAGDENILIYGSNLGPKVERLVNLSADPEIAGKIIIPAGVGVGPDVDLVDWVVPEQIPRNTPVAVRSSASDEDAGTGIYSSIFLLPSGGVIEDDHIKRTIRDVRCSSANNPSAGKLPQMGVLIQPVVGDAYDGCFAPAISGVITMSEKGMAIVRFATGLGTKVVQGRESAVMSIDDISANEISLALSKFNTADALVEGSNESPVQEIIVNDELQAAALSSIPKFLDLIAFWTSRGKNEYWEFAISRDEELPCVVQTHPNTSKGVIPIEFEPQVGRILFEGTDTVNYGTKQGGLIIVMGYNSSVSKADLARLELINRKSNGFLLVAPDTFFSDLSNIWNTAALEFKHFSNATGVVEIQHKREQNVGTAGPYSFTIDHNAGRGGTHFSGICKTKDILFIGTEDAFQIGTLGNPTEELGDSIAVYEVAFKVQNTSKGGRVEVVGESLQYEYKRKELDEWADTFWRYAEDLHGDSHFGEASKAFFAMLDLVLADMSGTATGVNLFSWRSHSDESINAMLEYIDIALKHLWLTPQYETYEDELEFAERYPEYASEVDEPIVFRLEEYLKRYRSILEAKN